MTVRNSRLVLLLAIILVFLAGEVAVATENYCKDHESWKEWEALVEKYPNDLDVRALHALRIGLCVKVERGNVTVEQATLIFERAREAIISKKKAETGKSEKLEL